MAVKLIEDVGSKNLGICFDTAQVLAALEIPSVSIHKLKNHIFHTHISDNLGSIHSNPHLTPDMGKIDWDETLKALKTIEYNYFLSLEIWELEFQKLDDEYIKGVNFLRELCNKYGI